MAEDQRVEFARRWYQRGLEEQCVFVRYFLLWLSAEVFAQWDTRNDGEAQRKVDYCFKKHHSTLWRVLLEDKNMKNALTRLAHRRGTRRDTPIIDTGCEGQRAYFDKLSHWLLCDDRDMGEAGERAHTLGAVLRRVRNNLFHGEKDYESTSDEKLLQVVNPILETCLCVLLPER